MQLKTLQNSLKDFLQDKALIELSVSPLRGLNIYKQNYFKNLTGALAGKYPTALEYLGIDIRKLFHNFICEFPSTSPNLDDYGDEFARYLADNNFTLAAKLAEIDWEIFTSLKNSEKPINARGLAHIPPEDFDRLTLKLNAALRLMKVNSRDFEVWKKLNKDFAIVKIVSQQQSAQQYLAISSIEDQIMINIVPASYHEALALIKAQENLLAIAGKILESDSNFNLSEFLAFCFNNRLITGFNLE